MAPVTPSRGVHDAAAPRLADRCSPPHVLLVEDDADTRELLEALLQMEGYRATMAANPRAALAAADDATIDVAVIDLRLPEMSGIELLGRLRSRAQFQPRLVVALTGSDDPDDRRRALRAGFTDYLVKPIALERLLNLLDAAVA